MSDFEEAAKFVNIFNLHHESTGKAWYATEVWLELNFFNGSLQIIT